MPYKGLLLSEHIGSCIPHRQELPFVLYSPPESLETNEMDQILRTRGAVRAQDPNHAELVLIHWLYQPMFNYVPGLTDVKFGTKRIFLFGAHLDYEIDGERIKAVYGSGIQPIFEHGGIICFTTEYLLESPGHIESIFSFKVFATKHY
jgi:hypothetical protein